MHKILGVLLNINGFDLFHREVSPQLVYTDTDWYTKPVVNKHFLSFFPILLKWSRWRSSVTAFPGMGKIVSLAQQNFNILG